MSRFLIDFGLNVAGATPSGSILSTAAQAAQEPYGRMQQAKSDRERAQYASEADMFKTLFEGAIETRTGGKTYAHRDKASMVRENMDKQYGIYDQLEGLDTEDPTYTDQREQLLKDLRTLKEQVSSDEFAKAQLQYWSDDRNSRKLDGWILKELEKQLGVPYDENNADHINAFNKRREEIMRDIKLGMSPTFKFAAGGRAGYQEGMSVMPTAMPAQEETMPEELGNISYDELRAILPQEVSDEVVQLLANSAEALEDFATIQTEQDIANFNKKYGVNLVLPSEG